MLHTNRLIIVFVSNSRINDMYTPRLFYTLDSMQYEFINKNGNGIENWEYEK